MTAYFTISLPSTLEKVPRKLLGFGSSKPATVPDEINAWRVNVLIFTRKNRHVPNPRKDNLGKFQILEQTGDFEF